MKSNSKEMVKYIAQMNVEKLLKIENYRLKIILH